jgi:chromosome segregation ATPase
MIPSNKRLYYVLVGLVLILFSLSFFTIRFEKRFDHLETVRSVLREKRVRYDYLNQNSGTIKLEINEVNAEVNELASRISQLVIHGNNMNDTIIRFMDQSVASEATIDTLESLQYEMAQSENEVDSLNQLFEEKSDYLIGLMDRYESSELDMNLMKSEIQTHSERVWYIKLFLLIYLFFIALGLITGVFFLIQGLK